MEPIAVRPGAGIEDRSIIGWTQAASNPGGRLPVLYAPSVSLRELRPTDARPLFESLAVNEVSRFISTPPSTVEGFEQFVKWTFDEARAGNLICYAIVPDQREAPAGIIQVRRLGADVAEWGFAIGQAYWGTGAFMESAEAVLDYVFSEVGVTRLEARASVENGRGNAVLRKLGANFEARLRKSFLKNGRYHDQRLWTVLDHQWLERRTPCDTEPLVLRSAAA